MKIVYISTPAFADCDLPLLKSIRQQGHIVHYFLRIAPYSLKSTLVDLESVAPKSGIYDAGQFAGLEYMCSYLENIPLHVVCDSVGKIGKDAIRLAVSLKNVIEEIAPDIVHIVECPSLLDVLSAIHFRRKLVMTIHDPLPHPGESKNRESIYRRLVLKAAGRIILLNDRQIESFMKRYCVSSEKIVLSCLGNYECMNDFGMGRRPDYPYILLFGRISPYKGIELAIEAALKLKQSHPDIKLVIAGSGTPYFDTDHLPDNVVLINRFIPTDELADLIHASLFVICPYTSATQSGVVQTAFALRKPAIVSNAGALPDAVDDGETGLVIKHLDAVCLHDAMDKLLSDSKLLADMSDNIDYGICQGKRSWKNIANTYLDAYAAIH